MLLIFLILGWLLYLLIILVSWSSVHSVSQEGHSKIFNLSTVSEKYILKIFEISSFLTFNFLFYFLSQIISYNVAWSVSSLFFPYTYSFHPSWILLLTIKFLSTMVDFSFTNVKSSFNDAISFSFSFRSTLYSSNFSFMNLIDSLTSSSCLARLI